MGVRTMGNTMDKKVSAKKMFILWEMMATLESMLWEIFFEEFMGFCAEKDEGPSSDAVDDYTL